MGSGALRALIWSVALASVVAVVATSPPPECFYASGPFPVEGALTPERPRWQKTFRVEPEGRGATASVAIEVLAGSGEGRVSVRLLTGGRTGVDAGGLGGAIESTVGFGPYLASPRLSWERVFLDSDRLTLQLEAQGEGSVRFSATVEVYSLRLCETREAFLGLFTEADAGAASP